jgi:hypothetical protein
MLFPLMAKEITPESVNPSLTAAQLVPLFV